MKRSEVWAAVADERRRLADELDGVPRERFDEPSRCDGWSAKVVLAHLVQLAEARLLPSALNVWRSGLRVDRSISRAAEAVAGGASVDELLARLRAGADGRFVAPGLPSIAALGEVLTHRADMAAALGLPPRPADERAAAVFDLYRRRLLAGYFGAPSSTRRVRLVPTDGDPAVGPLDGPEARGSGDALLLALAGRRSGIEELDGPGVALLVRPASG